MNAALRLPIGVSKEVRALLPAWLACTATVAAGGLADSMQLLPIAMFAYVLGTIALGAHAMGHEYTHRTLGLLLSQPSTRSRVFLTKMTVLGGMLLVLMAVAWVTVFDGPLASRLRHFHDPSNVLLVAMCGLFVAPCLTMICRNPLAAVVFTISIPGVLLVAGELLAIAQYGSSAYAQLDRARLGFLTRGMYIVCAAAAMGSWMLFMRLEAIEGRGTELHLPRWWSATTEAPAGRRNAVWQLVKKELRLQQMTFVLVAFFVLVWVSLSVLRRVVPELGELPLLPVSTLHLGLLSIVVGSLAGAEERQFGTLEWQVLLPMEVWRQWAIKVGAALSLAVLLGFGAPLLLARIDASPDDLRMHYDMIPVVMALTGGSLYLSSLCSSGMRAVVLALPVIFGMILSIDEGGRMITRAVHLVPPDFLVGTLSPARAVMPVESWAMLLVGSWVTLLLWFGMQNYRSGDRSFARVWRQAAWIGACAIIGMTLIAALELASRVAWLSREY